MLLRTPLRHRDIRNAPCDPDRVCEHPRTEQGVPLPVGQKLSWLHYPLQLVSEGIRYCRSRQPGNRSRGPTEGNPEKTLASGCSVEERESTPLDNQSHAAEQSTHSILNNVINPSISRLNEIDHVAFCVVSKESWVFSTLDSWTPVSKPGAYFRFRRM